MLSRQVRYTTFLNLLSVNELMNWPEFLYADKNSGNMAGLGQK